MTAAQQTSADLEPARLALPGRFNVYAGEERIG